MHHNVLVTDGDFSAYDLMSAIGPISGSIDMPLNNAFGSTAGAFVLHSVDGPSTFTAVVPTPEPSSLVFLGTGLAGLLWLASRARRERGHPLHL